MFKTNRKDLEKAASNRSSFAKRVQDKVDATHKRIVKATPESIAIKNTQRQAVRATPSRQAISRTDDTKKKLTKAFRNNRMETTK